jgi:hypothetical protein
VSAAPSEPVFRGQWRDEAALSAELAAYVKREVAGHPIPGIAGMLDAHSGSHLVFDDEDFLAMAVDAMVTTIRRHVGEDFIALTSNNRVTFTNRPQAR